MRSKACNYWSCEKDRYRPKDKVDMEDIAPTRIRVRGTWTPDPETHRKKTEKKSEKLQEPENLKKEPEKMKKDLKKVLCAELDRLRKREARRQSTANLYFPSYEESYKGLYGGSRSRSITRRKTSEEDQEQERLCFRCSTTWGRGSNGSPSNQARPGQSAPDPDPKAEPKEEEPGP